MKSFQVDEIGSLEGYVKQAIREYKPFRILRNLNFLYTWKLGDPKYDKDGLPIEASVKKLPTRERDLYGKDVELCVHFDSWDTLPKAQAYKLIFRTLLGIHVEVSGGEKLELVLDDDGRIIFHIVPPDIIIKMFSTELEKFGMPSRYKHTVRLLTRKEE